ncbi:MAG: glycosyltransferase [Janthinobacterium lividum]
MMQAPWQILDVGSIWMREFASAMARTHATVAWWPEMRNFGAFEHWERTEQIPEPMLEVRRFPLQRGYARTPVQQLLPYQAGLLKRLRSACAEESASPLICSTPFYAPMAERWAGPTVYYVTDLTAGYEGLKSEQVIALDKRMCRAAHAVCPNSRRLAEYLQREAGCAPEKITVVPNATRESNIAAAPLLTPGTLPEAIAHLPRPIAGIVGNLSANMDWELIEPAIAATPWLTWVFVGPTSMPIADPVQAAARTRVMEGGRAHFTGGRPYGELQAYARCFDVAVLPYRKKEPTYSGSSTRFYEHVAACRPMVATRGFAELLEKPPLLELVDTAEEMREALEQLRAVDFRDGLEIARWEASRQGTWEERVRTLTGTLKAS